MITPSITKLKTTFSIWQNRYATFSKQVSYYFIHFLPILTAVSINGGSQFSMSQSSGKGKKVCSECMAASAGWGRFQYQGELQLLLNTCFIFYTSPGSKGVNGRKFVGPGIKAAYNAFLLIKIIIKSHPASSVRVHSLIVPALRI